MNRLDIVEQDARSCNILLTDIKALFEEHEKGQVKEGTESPRNILRDPRGIGRIAGELMRFTDGNSEAQLYVRKTIEAFSQDKEMTGRAIELARILVSGQHKGKLFREKKTQPQKEDIHLLILAVEARRRFQGDELAALVGARDVVKATNPKCLAHEWAENTIGILASIVKKDGGNRKQTAMRAESESLLSKSRKSRGVTLDYL